MAVTVDYNEIGHGVNMNGSLYYDFYGADFNPQEFDITGWESLSIYNSTSSFNLSNFQPGHEVGCGLVIITPNGWSGTLYCDLYRNGSYATYTSFVIHDVASDQQWGGFFYFGVDKDEIRPGYSTYNIHYYSTDGEIDFWSPDFTVSNLSIDSTYHKSGYLWVEGSHLCYTDNTGDEDGMNGYGFKHKIAFDSSYSTDVGSDNKGFIWLDENNNLQIYYVDASGLRRRTYLSKERYGGAVNVGSENKGYMWVGVQDPSKGYGYLCFVNPNGNKRRILNGPPIGYV